MWKVIPHPLYIKLFEKLYSFRLFIVIKLQEKQLTSNYKMIYNILINLYIYSSFILSLIIPSLIILIIYNNIIYYFFPDTSLFFNFFSSLYFFIFYMIESIRLK